MCEHNIEIKYNENIGKRESKTAILNILLPK